MEPKIIHRLDSVITEVKKKTGINIDNLKPAFLERRVLYRMRNIEISDYGEYVKLLSTSFDEAKSLYNVFSINVTKFFRDPHVWEKLEQDVVPILLKQTRFSPIRAWSCGSASGEEPHSISILLDASLKEKRMSYQVYATDISADAIAHAKTGLYQNENLVNVSTERLDTYFEKTPEGKFQIDPQIGKRIEYQRVDMMKTTGKLFDIIFCRNVAIYFPEEKKKSLFNRISKLLKPDGVLIIGGTESIATICPSFESKRYLRSIFYQLKQ
ncbi:protein-glutamate O-methyltransferase CheR [bacterium]|nr:protein-glutamate O-methyltransferase CheR [bacterium]